MKTMKSLLMAASVSLALAFTFSGCSSDGDDGKDQGTSICDGQTFKTIVIGTQTWMAENLNCNVNGSKCGSRKPTVDYRALTLEDENTDICDEFGRLYDWATAMALPSSCNSKTCSNQVQSKHRGICPSGWHIPSNAEWETLINYVGGESVAGSKLKATSGWWGNGDDANGTDNYGFTALPGGVGFDGWFHDVGDYGYWWSSSEYDANYVHFRIVSSFNEKAYYGFTLCDDEGYCADFPKPLLFSVRCVKD
jgi:uncharacterized protein (TIGR02145 family)